MEGTVLSWTRIERPPSGFGPGRVVALVEAGAERRYALWEHAEAPAIGARVRLARSGEGWVASAP